MVECLHLDQGVTTDQALNQRRCIVSLGKTYFILCLVRAQPRIKTCANMTEIFLPGMQTNKHITFVNSFLDFKSKHFS